MRISSTGIQNKEVRIIQDWSSGGQCITKNLRIPKDASLSL